jgi:hypothetical protein
MKYPPVKGLLFSQFSVTFLSERAVMPVTAPGFIDLSVEPCTIINKNINGSIVLIF